jgi:hypothetical protein
MSASKSSPAPGVEGPGWSAPTYARGKYPARASVAEVALS